MLVEWNPLTEVKPLDDRVSQRSFILEYPIPTDSNLVWQNTTEGGVIVFRAIIYVIEGAPAGITIDVGSAATSTSSNNLMDDVPLDEDGFTRSSLVPVYVPAGHYITATSSGSPTGMVAWLYLEVALTSI